MKRIVLLFELALTLPLLFIVVCTEKKWWKPKDDEQRKLFENAKQVCYLAINKEGVKARLAYGEDNTRLNIF